MTMVISFFSSSGSLGHLGLLEGEKNLAADAQRVVDRLQARRVLRPFRMAEVAGHAAERDDEIIVGDAAVGQDDRAGLEVDRLHLAELAREMFSWSLRIERNGLAISTEERLAVATW